MLLNNLQKTKSKTKVQHSLNRYLQLVAPAGIEPASKL